MSRALFALLAVLPLLVTGCPKPADPPQRAEIYAITAAPPSKTAQIVSSDDVHRIVLDHGVAVAVSGWTTCPNNPSLALVSADPTVLGARAVYRNGMANQFLVFGGKPGVTTLTVRGGCTEQRYDVEVR